MLRFCFLLAIPALLQAQGSVEGNVVNAITGAPIAGARVRLESGDSDPSYTKTDEKGHFRFSGAEWGTVLAERPGFLSMRPIRAQAGSAATVRLTPAAVMSGKVLGPDGIPLPGTVVEILARKPAGPVAQTRGMADDRGDFRVANLEAGTYSLMAHSSPTGGWPSSDRLTYYPEALDLASAKPIELAAGQQARADIRILRQSGVRVAGRLIGLPDGESFKIVSIVPQVDYTTIAHSPLAAVDGGRFEFPDVLPGKYRVIASMGTPDGAFGGRIEYKLGATQDVEVTEHGLDGVELRLLPLRDVAGTVTWPEGCRPSAPVTVLATGENTRSLGAVGADGQFVLKSLAPGRIKIHMPSPATSVLLDDQDISQAGFDYPFTGAETLHIAMPCNGGRSR